MPARRDSLVNVNANLAAHAGLWLDSYLSERDAKAVARKRLQQEAKAAMARAGAVYERGFARWKASLEPSHLVKVFETTGRFVTGMGDGGVLETGLTLQHTYGTPVIPGSTIKGVCSHYFVTEVESRIEGDKAEAHKFRRLVFGTQKYRGMITFEDAWMLPASLPQALQLDVMTPHEIAYYRGKGAPTGQGDPKPISFLSVQGRFLVAVACENSGELGATLAGEAMKLIERALGDWGAGGKTRAGYGRMKAI